MLLFLNVYPKIKSTRRRGRFTLNRKSISGVNVFLVAVLLLTLLIVGEQAQASEYQPAVVETDHIALFKNTHLSAKDQLIFTQTFINNKVPPDAADNDFTGEPVFTISGMVRDFQNQPIQGVSLTDGAGQIVFTDSNGDYEFIDLPTGTYSITPAYEQFVFSPVSRQVSVPPKASKQDFIQVKPSIFLPIVTRKACQSLYLDDFSDPNSGWPNFEDENRRYEYIDGEYEILVKNADSWAGASPDFQVSEYYVGVDVRSTTGVIGSHGIIFGLTEDWSGFYTFEIDPEGYYTVWRYNENGGWKNLIVEFSPFINKSTEVNRLKVKQAGNSIEVYANGNLLTTRTDKTYSGVGYVGLIVSSFDEINVEARFDNFYVNPNACGSTLQLSPSQTRKGMNSQPEQPMFFEIDNKFR